MGAMVISIFAIICFIGWIKWKVTTRAIIYYLQENKYTPPSDEEMKACSEYVIMKMLGR